MRSPGPQWVALQEPSASSTEDEPDSDTYPVELTTLKRKPNTSVPQPTQKRPKLAPELIRREQVSGEVREASKIPTLSHQGKPKSIQSSMGRVSSVAGSFRPSDGKKVASNSVASDGTRQSLLKFRPTGASSVAKTKVIQRPTGKEKSSEDSGMNATSPPASSSPPPESSTKPIKEAHTSMMPRGERRPYSATKPRKPSANPRARPTHPHRSVSSPTDIIEISSDESSPKSKAPSVKHPRPPPSKRQSLPAIPKNSEIIVIDDSDEETTVPSSRSAPPSSENSASLSTISIAHPVTPPHIRDKIVIKSSPLSRDAEDNRMLSNSSPSPFQLGRSTKAVRGDTPSNSYQSRRPEHALERPPVIDLRRLSGFTRSPRNAKPGNSNAPGSLMTSTPLPKSTFPRKPSSLRPSSSSSAGTPHDKPARPTSTRNDSLDLDIGGLKVADITPSPPLHPLSIKTPGSSGSGSLPDRHSVRKTNAQRPLSSSSVAPARTSTGTGNTTPSTRPIKATKSKQARSSGTSGILRDTRPALSQPTQTLAEAITQASESNAKRGSSKQDAIDLTSDPPVATGASESLDGAIASSQFLQSLIESGDMGKLPGISSRPSTPITPIATSTVGVYQTKPSRRTSPSRQPFLGRSHTSPTNRTSLDTLTSDTASAKPAKSQTPINASSADTSKVYSAVLPSAFEANNITNADQVPAALTHPTSKSTPAVQRIPAISASSLVPSPQQMPPHTSTPSASSTSHSPRATAAAPLTTQPSKKPASDDQLENIDQSVPTNQDSDLDEMDVMGLLTTTPPITEVPPSYTPGTPLSDDEAEELVAATSGLAMASTTGSSPDPLDMGVSSSPGQPMPLSDSSSANPPRLSRRSSMSSNDPISLFADDDFETPPKTRSLSPYDSSKVVATKTFGGFTSLNWKTFRQDVNNFTQKCYLAKDLPHSLQDHINCWSPIAQRFAGLRTVLECYIQENTADDEPDAPMIEIINDIDDDPTPPWEFHYSNKMWHGEGVPPPDVSRLTSCGCTGKCDPKSKTCACLKRQQHYTGAADFAYDGKSRLKLIDYPIFECNDLCGCDEECRNRVVQHGRKCAVNIKKTAEKGWGVFAGSKKIYQGNFVGIYAGELLTDAVGEERGVNYNKFGRTYLFDLDFHHLKEGKESWDVQYTVDAYHAGNFTRFLNHSCDPNCQLVPCYINESNIEKPLLTVFTRRDIEPFEELCFSYSGDYPEDDDKLDPRSSPSAADREDQAVYAKCACRAKNCTGVMFK